MAFIVKSTQTQDYTPIPAGVYVARCYRLVDLGTQKVVTKFGEKQQRKINLAWEIFGEDENAQPLTIKIDGRDMPMTVSKSYTRSIHEKSALRRDLESWRGRKFSDTDLEGFDLQNILNSYCMLNITNVENEGKTYARVESITPLMAMFKTNKPAPVHEILIFDLDEFSEYTFNKLPKGMQEYIRKSYEYPPNMASAAFDAQSQTAPTNTPENPPPARKNIGERIIAAMQKCQSEEELFKIAHHIDSIPESDIRERANDEFDQRLKHFQNQRINAAVMEEFDEIPY